MSPRQPDSNIEWQKWGEVDPLFGVAAWEGREKGGSNPWTDEEFYALGRADWNDFKVHWERYGLDRTTCLEIGCGAGRLTLHLARDFKTVHAFDVSRRMLDYARRNITDENVHFHLSDGITIPLSDRSVTAVFSTHVFQHFDTRETAFTYFQEFARVLVPGGSLMIHLPIYRWPAMHRLFSRLYQVRQSLAGIRARIQRHLMTVGLARPIMRGLGYSSEHLFTTLPTLGFKDVEIAIFPTRSNNDPHPVVFARR